MSVSTAVAADALGLSAKKLDNLLNRSARVMVSVGRQGRRRRISPEAIERLAVALLLRRDLGVPLSRGLNLADQLRSSRESQVPVGVLGSLQFDMTRLRSVLEQALADAVDGHESPRRGRPRKQPK